ncbi:RagB/SusD family nutrient uptake outer membrane protein [Arthrospiribacter ruber]|uniref:RagB/SusD family nutrient uptake outer membrane protein n=1 Tax=Arthrospiribacter ruber TaxID=2487934 RepID=A0A951MCK1_9BACT|nr:RagB/SusD family nutrient uptake outer membrane protein [Arthrospiribacter ruber]MBW3467005.1 RagB/SusD family nutrient uptake outer membrane protein [Arthrospiribacter ruber]
MKNLHKKIFTLFIAGALILSYSCSDDFLRVNPIGTLDENVLRNVAGAEKLLIGVYSNLDGTSQNVTSWNSASSNWIYGSIAGGEANKGSDAGDNALVAQVQTFSMDAANDIFNGKWRIVYDGIARTNTLINLLNTIEGEDEATILRIRSQAVTLRGHYHFEAKRLWGNVPYLNEDTEGYYVPNDQDIWPLIEADLRFGYENLPESMGEVGRVNKWVAGAMLAKALIYQQKFQEAKPIVEAIINNGVNPMGVKYALIDNFSDNFDIEHNNSAESVFAWQYSANDGSGGWNAGYGEILNFPYGGPGSCCGFFQPSQEFVNSFRVDSNGLPMLDGSYNSPENAVKSDDGLASTDPFDLDNGPLDPRLDWTVGRRGIPFFDWGLHPGRDWIRDQNYGGPYTPKKQLYKKSQEGLFTEVGQWTTGLTANNYNYIRFAEVILWAAEIEIELGNLDLARDYINMIRERAKNSEYVTYEDGSAAANYQVDVYPPGHIAFSSQIEARKALYFERKLELGLEGHRFFDLVRWGVANEYLNDFINYESQIRTQAYQGAAFNPGTNNVYPIPLFQIDISRGTLQQNPGY